MAEDNIAALLKTWRETKQPIVHIRHISRFADSVFWPGQAGAEFQERFTPLPNEHVVEKNVPDAFIATALERWLRVRSITNLVIVGVITNNSVEATARSAGNLGFSVMVVHDACFTFDKADFSGRPHTAEEVHDMSLANLQGEYALILSTAEILNS